MIWTAPGKCLIAWDMGQGPTFDTDAKSKALGQCEVWRAQDPENLGGSAVCIGETKAEAFLDTNAQNGACYYYWVMERMSSGGLRQTGPVLDVEMPCSWEYPYDTAPTEPDEVTAIGTADGVRLDWLAAVDGDDEQAGRSGLVAYFLYDSNQDAPDSVIWVDEDRIGDTFTDYLSSGTEKSYQLRALNRNLILSAPSAIVNARAGVIPRNLVPNPRFHVNAVDGWYPDTTTFSAITRETEPGPELPDGADACGKFTSRYFQTVFPQTEWLTLPAEWETVFISVKQWADGGVDSFLSRPYAWYANTARDVFWGGEIIEEGGATGNPGAAFSEAWQLREIPAGPGGEKAALVHLICIVILHAADSYYVTQAMLSDSQRAYADGDTVGWEWDGEAHNSASREA